MRIASFRQIVIISLCIINTLFISAQVSPDTSALFKHYTVPSPEDDIYLSEKDYENVAKQLGIEIATIKAVVEIETGQKHNGFSHDLPILNFDATMFRRFLKQNNIKVSKYQSTHSTAFKPVNIKKYGSYTLAQHARLKSARKIDIDIANKSAFWGMFQIGGFNWKKCGTKSVSEFVTLMSESEHSQLQLFVNFLVSSNMVRHLKTKNWTAFARAYNGSSAISKGYHTKLAKAYRKYSK